MAVDRIHLAAAVIGALAWVTAVGQEDVEVEEVAAVLVTTGMGEAVDALAEFVGVVRIGELLSVAKSYAVVHPFHRDSLPAAEECE